MGAEEDRAFHSGGNDEIAARYDALSDESQRVYKRHLEIITDYRDNRTPPFYRETLLDTIEKKYPYNEQARQIAAHNRAFAENPNWKLQELDQQKLGATKSALHAEGQGFAQEPQRPGQLSLEQRSAILGPQDINDDHKHGLLTRAANALQQTPQAGAHEVHTQSREQPSPPLPTQRDSRDYTELHLAHQAHDDRLRDAGLQPVEDLQQKLTDYEKHRVDHGLAPDQHETNSRDELARQQAEDRDDHNRSFGPANSSNTHELLDHQHLAERVSLEARLLRESLGDQDPELSRSLGQDSREAAQTGRLVHEQRQLREANLEPSQSGKAQDSERSDTPSNDGQSNQGQSRGGSGGRGGR